MIAGHPAYLMITAGMDFMVKHYEMFQNFITISSINDIADNYMALLR